MGCRHGSVLYSIFNTSMNLKIQFVLQQKQGGSEGGAKSPSGTVADRAAYVVFRQPLPMDRFAIHDIAPPDASGE